MFPFEKAFRDDAELEPKHFHTSAIAVSRSIFPNRADRIEYAIYRERPAHGIALPPVRCRHGADD